MFKSLTKFLLMVVISVGICTIVFGASSHSLNVYYNNLKILIDGVQLDLNKNNAVNSEPFISDGVTFVPLRLISEALQCKVDWNDKDKSVLITTNNQPIVWGIDGLYHGFSTDNGVELGDKISEEATKWAKSIDGDAYVVLTCDLDGNPMLLKMINNKGETLHNILDISQFKANLGINLDKLLCTFKNGNIELACDKMVGTSSVETFVYSVDIKSNKITVIDFSPAYMNNLGSFNGNQQKYNAFIKERISQEQNKVDLLVEK